MKYPTVVTCALAFAAALIAGKAVHADAADIAACNDIDAHPKPSERIVFCTEGLKTPGISTETRISLLRGRGHAYYDVSKFGKAIADHTEILRLNPNDAEAYFDRGWVNWSGGKYTPAIKDLTQAIKLKPDYADAYSTRASSYLLSKRYALSIEDWGMVIKLKPDDSMAYSLRCHTRAVGNTDLDAAVEDCTAALKLSKIYSTYETRALAQYHRGDMSAAIADANEALAITSVAYGARYIMGVAKLRLGDTAGGNADIATAKSLEPNVVKEYATYGVTP